MRVGVPPIAVHEATRIELRIRPRTGVGCSDSARLTTMTIGKVRPAVLKMASYTPGKAAGQVEAEHGVEDAIKLASNENPWPPVPAVIDAITNAVAGVNRYGDNRATDVRGAISDWLGIDEGSITVGCGSSGLLQQLFMVYVDPGDEVVFPYPSFEVYPIFSTQFGATPVTVPLVNFAFDLDAVAAAVTDRTKLVFLATPNNPTGTSVSVNELRGFLDAIPNDVIVVIDEAYREFNDPEMGDPASLLSAHPNVVITRTFSKAFGLAGLRSGYGLCDPAIVTELDKVRLPFSINNLAQVAVLAAIEHRAEAMERVGTLIEERARCVAALAVEGYEVPAPNGNFIFIPTGEATSSIAQRMEKDGVVTRPFPDLGLRISVGTADENARWFSSFVKAG